MTKLNTQIKPIPTSVVKALRSGGLDSNNQLPQIQLSDGNGNPCRHCLKLIEDGEEMLVFSHKPFSSTQPYAEQGPIFIHAKDCAPYQSENGFPEILEDSSHFIVRGYDSSEQIVYGTGKVVPYENIETYASELLANGAIEFVHVRSSTNNCFQARVEKA